jgi:cell wall-associated NlpC family hydrolase
MYNLIAAETVEREALVKEALSWVGTPYHHGADVKGVGTDCGMLLVRCFVDSGLVPPFDPRPYPSQWHLHQFAEKYLHWVDQWAKKVKSPEEGRELLPGDIVMFKYGHTYAHGSIVIDWPIIIHALGPRPVTRATVELDSFLRRLPKIYYSIWPRG